eukprot:365300-Chlamydomonas_euryale.AAC.15
MVSLPPSPLVPPIVQEGSAAGVVGAGGRRLRPRGAAATPGSCRAREAGGLELDSGARGAAAAAGVGGVRGRWGCVWVLMCGNGAYEVFRSYEYAGDGPRCGVCCQRWRHVLRKRCR